MARGYPDFEGDKSGIYPRSVWAAKEGEDKSLAATAANQAWGGSANGLYRVPAGKTFYITDVSWYGVPDLIGDADNQHHVHAGVFAPDAGTYKFTASANGGGSASFDTPKLVPAGGDIVYNVYCRANHVLDIGIMVGGFEI